jgi:glycosyltransferase involved in cell wall biosynthesis
MRRRVELANAASCLVRDVGDFPSALRELQAMPPSQVDAMTFEARSYVEQVYDWAVIARIVAEKLQGVV